MTNIKRLDKSNLDPLSRTNAGLGEDASDKMGAAFEGALIATGSFGLLPEALLVAPLLEEVASEAFNEGKPCKVASTEVGKAEPEENGGKGRIGLACWESFTCGGG